MKEKTFLKNYTNTITPKHNMSKCPFFMKGILHVQQVVPMLTIVFILTNTFCISVRQCHYFKCQLEKTKVYQKRFKILYSFS